MAVLLAIYREGILNGPHIVLKNLEPHILIVCLDISLAFQLHKSGTEVEVGLPIDLFEKCAWAEMLKRCHHADSFGQWKQRKWLARRCLFGAGLQGALCCNGRVELKLLIENHDSDKAQHGQDNEPE